MYVYWNNLFYDPDTFIGTVIGLLVLVPVMFAMFALVPGRPRK